MCLVQLVKCAKKLARLVIEPVSVLVVVKDARSRGQVRRKMPVKYFGCGELLDRFLAQTPLLDNNIYLRRLGEKDTTTMTLSNVQVVSGYNRPTRETQSLKTETVTDLGERNGKVKVALIPATSTQSGN